MAASQTAMSLHVELFLAQHVSMAVKDVNFFLFWSGRGVRIGGGGEVGSSIEPSAAHRGSTYFNH